MKKVVLFLVAVMVASANYAQGQEKALKQYGFWDNWFIQGQFGVQRTYSESHKYASFGDKISPTAALNVGKFFSPEVGARLQLGGWTSANNIINHSYNVKYYNANVDALFNMTNIFLPYRENRVFNLIGILGVGYVHGFKNSSEKVNRTNFASPRAGLQTDFRVNEKWSLNLEANANLLRDDFNGQYGYGCLFDGTLNVLAGVTFHFSKRGFATVEPSDPALIQSLNDKINAQRSEIESLNDNVNKQKALIDEYKACCEKKQAAVEPAPAEKENLNTAVIFRIGKAKIDPNQEVNIYNAAQYLKQNPDAKIIIASYCDKKTGTPSFNQRLSEKRSAAVVKVLKKKYGINENRFTVVNNGDKVQPYPDNNS